MVSLLCIYVQAVEFSKLVSSLRPDEPEDVIVSACQKLTAFFHQRPEQKIVFITQHGLLPLMELLEVPRTSVCHLFEALSSASLFCHYCQLSNHSIFTIMGVS